jgi:hypothetical protein
LLRKIRTEAQGARNIRKPMVGYLLTTPERKAAERALLSWSSPKTRAQARSEAANLGGLTLLRIDCLWALLAPFSLRPLRPRRPLGADWARRADRTCWTYRTGYARITLIALWTRGTWRPCRPPKPIATT